MTLRQQVIKDRTAQLAQSLKVTEDVGFMRLSHSLVTGQSVHAFDPADLTDGGQEKQIDVFTIDEVDDTSATIYIMQVKNTESFSSNALILLRNGLEWVFNKPRTDLSTLSNTKLRDRIVEYRALQSDLGPSNIQIVVAFVTNAPDDSVSPEFAQEQKTIVDQYDNGTFATFSLQVWSADSLVAQINALERRSRKIDADIPIRYDTNSPSLIRYDSQGLKGVICTTFGREIARIVNSDPTESVFDMNVRRFLGTRGAVNSDILRTCSQTESSNLFWFLNNGITIVCDSVDTVTDPDYPHVKVKNLQIVNGCQTAKTLALAEKAGTLARDVRVLLRVYETKDDAVVDKIVLTTNNQNKITSRDLKSNDDAQLDMERMFRSYDYFYERKPRQYDTVPNIAADRIAANEIVAQCYLAVVLKKPSDARRRKYKVWGEMYDEVFSGKVVEPFIVSFLAFRRAAAWLRQYSTDTDETRRKIANNGAFHIARLATQVWLGKDLARMNAEDLKGKIASLEPGGTVMDHALGNALGTLEKILTDSNHYRADLDNALKSGALDEDMNKAAFSLTSSQSEP